MKFVHDDPTFQPLLEAVAFDSGIDAAFVEKDYWITHILWALHKTGLEIWFKGGTSLSMGFDIIHRFSEDLDLMVEHGTCETLPAVSNWKSANKKPASERAAFFDALARVMDVPAVRIERNERKRDDKRALGAEYIGYYPGEWLDQLAPTASPFVRLELGRGCVVPWVSCQIGSFLHSHLEKQGVHADYMENGRVSVRCVHPLVTLLEKLDAISRRYPRDQMNAESFVRHYEDTTQIIRRSEDLPELAMTLRELADALVDQRVLSALPNAGDAAYNLESAERRAQLETAYDGIAPMFWDSRISLDQCCCEIREWLDGL